MANGYGEEEDKTNAWNMTFPRSECKEAVLLIEVVLLVEALLPLDDECGASARKDAV